MGKQLNDAELRQLVRDMVSEVGEDEQDCLEVGLWMRVYMGGDDD